MGWDKLMAGKTARVIITSKNWPVVERMLFGDFKNEVGKALLGFAGYKVRITEIGRAENMSDSTKDSWMKTISKTCLFCSITVESKNVKDWNRRIAERR